MRTGDRSSLGAKVIGLKFHVLGKIIEHDLKITKARSRLSDIVPLARKICQNITDAALENSHKNNEYIPCTKGCSACCSHYLVPLSVPEAFRLKDDISILPDNIRKSIWEQSLDIARKILESKPPELFFQQYNMLESDQIDLNSLSNWYSNLNIACPFLKNDLCSIYKQRPLACREHFIKGPAAACSGGHAEAEVIDIPIQMPVILGKLAAEFERRSTEAVILPLTLIWTEDNQGRAERTWPTEMLVDRLIEIIRETADNYSKKQIGHRETVMCS